MAQHANGTPVSAPAITAQHPRRAFRIAALLMLVAAVSPALAGIAHADPTSLPDGVVVCNEAQNSPRGTMDATSSTDPLPPARHKDAAMPVGQGGGLLNAAANSPALAVCTPAPPDDDGDPGPI